jgi:type III pantothenate kinase
MNLIIDIGNSQIKTAVFEDNTLVLKANYPHLDWEINLKKKQERFPKINQIVVSNVGNIENEAIKRVFTTQKWFEVTRDTQFPYTNLYQTPQTLGIDRMVLAAGAVLQFPAQNRLIIDAGTCITYDFVDNQDRYLGGSISPGIHMRYQALHDYTAKLPLLTAHHPENVLGDSTEQAIHSGVVSGVLFEIDGVIADYQSKYENFIIILTGGDADFLAKRLKNTIFANPNFLLESLNQLFQYNQK